MNNEPSLEMETGQVRWKGVGMMGLGFNVGPPVRLGDGLVKPSSTFGLQESCLLQGVLGYAEGSVGIAPLQHLPLCCCPFAAGEHF